MIPRPLTALMLALAFGPAASQAVACTRCVYLGSGGTVLTARSMDWAEDIRSNMWLFPRGMARDGATGPRTLTWTSRHGSVIVTGYDVGTADGMNERGLVANLLYLAESDYGVPAPDATTLSIGAWGQFVLDTCATVAEAVERLTTTPLTIVAPSLPDGHRAALHLAVSDPSGDSAIFEYVGGKLTVHHGRQFRVMTNSPAFDEQLALNRYWEQIGGTVFLPGTHRAADRFARASFAVESLPATADARDALAGLLGVIRGVSVPLGVRTPGQPNIASTRWRTVADQKERVYYFDDATRPSIFWVRLADLDFREGQPVRKLTITGDVPLAGDMSAAFAPAAPFAFLGSQ